MSDDPRLQNPTPGLTVRCRDGVVRWVFRVRKHDVEYYAATDVSPGTYMLPADAWRGLVAGAEVLPDDWTPVPDPAAEIARLTAEVKRLRGLVEEAYREGNWDGYSGSSGGGCWEYSDAKKALGGRDE